MNLERIQAALREQGVDGWLFFDHHQRDPLAYRILGLAPVRTVTRRWYYLVPSEGEPVGLVHRIEPDVLGGLPGSKLLYASWREQIQSLQRMLAGTTRVAMQYSPDCRLPAISLVDAGTVELIRGLGVEVVSSADLVQEFEARWTANEIASHILAAKKVDGVRREAFQWLSSRIRQGDRVREGEVKEFVLRRLRAEGLCTDHGPIVASGKNSANPHYEPVPGGDREIRFGDVVLLDVWAKLDAAEAVYCDVTWVAFCGERAPESVERVFRIVVEARDRAVAFVRNRIRSGATVKGFEVDDAARGYIEECGYGPHFTHRTGHSIGREVHGAGANADNLETHDDRRLIPWTCISVEPGIYVEEFGVRTEVDLLIEENDARVTGEIQQEIVLL